MDSIFFRKSTGRYRKPLYIGWLSIAAKTLDAF